MKFKHNEKGLFSDLSQYVFLMALLLPFLNQIAYGQDKCELSQIEPKDGGGNVKYFGGELSISQNMAIVSAQWDKCDGIETGSAYVFNLSKEGWNQTAKLVPKNGAKRAFVGIRVAIKGTFAMISAPHKDDAGLIDSGLVYVFEFKDGKWIEKEPLRPKDPKKGLAFGLSTWLGDNLALIGAPGYSRILDKDNGSMQSDERDNYNNPTPCIAGSVYVFEKSKSGWKQTGKLVPREGKPGDNFGISVSMWDNIAVIGANLRNKESGSAYIFKKTFFGWVENQVLSASDGKDGDLFGKSVDIYKDTILVGASCADMEQEDIGAAYIFSREQEGKNDGLHEAKWMQAAKLVTQDKDYSNYFGFSVALWGESAIVGAWGDNYYKQRKKQNPNILYSGSAYIFEKVSNEWTQTKKLISNKVTSGGMFGSSVDIYGNWAFVGEHREGVVYILNRN